MATRSQGRSERRSLTGEATRDVRLVHRVLTQAGFKVQRNFKRDDSGLDMTALRRERGRDRRYGIVIRFSRSPIPVEVVREAAGILQYAVSLSDVWVIGHSFTDEARALTTRLARVQLFTVNDLDLFLQGPDWENRSAWRGVERTSARGAILANHAEIVTTSASLLVLIEERLRSLRSELPNSDEAKAERDEAIAQYEKLKADIKRLADAAAKLKKGKIKGEEAEKASQSLADGLKKWWTKSHQKICEKAYDMSLFASAVGLCSIACAGGDMAVATSAALVGGKHLGDALKSLKGIWK